jgi:hypothetical protein
VERSSLRSLEDLAIPAEGAGAERDSLRSLVDRVSPAAEAGVEGSLGRKRNQLAKYHQ